MKKKKKKNKDIKLEEEIINQKEIPDKFESQNKIKLILEKVNNEQINICGIKKEPQELKEKENEIKEEAKISPKDDKKEMTKEVDKDTSLKRGITISKRIVIRKSINNSFKNNEIISEQVLNIKGTEKSKPKQILEKQSLENNTFTIEKTIDKTKEENKLNEGLLSEQDTKKISEETLPKTQNIDNCIQLNIERIYENKTEKDKDKDKNNEISNEQIQRTQNSFVDLLPEEQNNNRFAITNISIKPKETTTKDSLEEKNKTILEKINNEEINICRSRIPKENISLINKNDEFIIEATKETPTKKEIKITTKRILRKNIVLNKFKNNEVISENIISINGIKNNPILEEESQDNNRFTVEKTKTKSDEEENKRNKKTLW